MSLEIVEDMPAALGIIVSHQTIRLRAGKFGRTFANDIRRRSSGSATSGIWMRPLFRSVTRSTGSGEP
ncbi:putative transposase protein (plasmid) [Rhizobium sp. CCGE 510]|nr:putative transposase protein [Rhizobium sp. CCGE 510]